jgi:putative ABC transport system permease protein
MVETVGVKGQGSGATALWWRSPHWRKAPFVLLRHRSALAAVAVSGLLVALAASSGPLVTTAAASSALKDELVDLTPFGTGLQITGLSASRRGASRSIHAENAREGAVRALASRLDLEAPVFSVETALPLNVSTPTGDVPLNLLARTDVLDHVKILSQADGPGVYISDFTARIARVRPGGKLRLGFSQLGNGTKSVVVRVKGIYKALDTTSPGPYWVHFLREIFPPGVDPPPSTRYVLIDRNELYRVVHRLSVVHTVQAPGRVLHVAESPPVTTMAELAVDPGGLTIARARALTRSFARLRHQLRASTLGDTLGCTGPSPFVRPGQLSPPRCRVASSLASAVAIADRNVSEISPVVTLLSGAATAIALAFAGASGIFLVRRRSAEAALLYARGERSWTFAARTGLELFVPVVVGATVGFGLALAATGLLSPSGSVDSGTVDDALRDGALAAVAALLFATVAATFAFLRQFDSGARAHPWVSRIPWELPLLIAAGWLLYDLLSGGGLAGQSSGAGHPTLAVFVFPLLLVAAAAGLVVRVLRPALRLSAGRAAALPTAIFLAIRRLAAAGAVLTALLVVTAVSFGSYFYSEAVASSLSSSVSQKAYLAYGGDAQGLIAGSASLPRNFRYPVTRFDYGNQSAVFGGPNGNYADVLAVDAATLGSVIHWYPGWGTDPRQLLPRLRHLEAGRLPIVVSDAIPADTPAIWVQGGRLPVRVVARVHVFPGMSAGVPVVVADRSALVSSARKAGVLDPLSDPPTYVWAKGPPAAVARSLGSPPVEASFVSTVEEFRKQPDVLAATRAFSYMRLVAVASGVLVFLGLVLYLGARQRSEAVASSLAARMGLSRRTEILSLAVELGAITLIAAVVGGGVALAAAAPVVGHIDPLPAYLPGPVPAIPLTAILASAVALVVIAVGAGAFTSWASRRTNMGEALRVV